MSQFEYVSVAISIVLSLSGAQLLAGLRHAWAPARRDWIHSVWIILILYVHVIFWWGLWSYRDVPTWNLASFLLLLAVPGLLFLCSNALMSGRPETVESWHVHFDSVRRWFFVSYGLLVFVVFVRESVLLGRPFLHPIRLNQGLSMLVAATGSLSANRRVNAALVVIECLNLVGPVSIDRFFLAP